MKRVFIAINLPDDVKKALFGQQERIEALFDRNQIVRWTSSDNLHITLLFLGHLTDEAILEVCKIAEGVAESTPAFEVVLNSVCYGPPKKMPPRMVWIEGRKSEEFSELRKNLERELLSSDKIRFSSQKQEFSPHITLGRIKTWVWRQIEPEERPEISEEVSLSFSVGSIEVMESRLKRGGPEYVVLESCNLKP